MSKDLSPRDAAETIEQFGDDLGKLLKDFDHAIRRMSSDLYPRIDAIPNQEHLDTIAADFITLGRFLSRECDLDEEDDDRRRANPLEPDFRRLG